MKGRRGTLVLVVGPSGAGKDSIIRAASAAFSNDTNIVFPRRVVTRKADIAAEDHDTVSDMDFAHSMARGDYAIWWQAHANSYGIPISIDDDLRLGRIVIFNCSRTMVEKVRIHYAHVVVVDIQVSPDVLVQRIVARGREGRDEALARVARLVPPFPAGTDVTTITNDSELETAVQTFCAFVRSLNHAHLNKALSSP